jgi:glyoxylate carboligase
MLVSGPSARHIEGASYIDDGCNKRGHARGGCGGIGVCVSSCIGSNNGRQSRGRGACE